MRRRSWFATILTAALLALVLWLLLHGRDGSVVDPAERAIRPEAGEPQYASPTLLSREAEPPPAATPAPTASPGRTPTLRLRVTASGTPLPGALISFQHVGPAIEEEAPDPITTDQDGRAAVPLEESMFPVAIVVRGRARDVPKAITLNERPDEEILVDLEAGQRLTVRTIDMNRKPLPGISVIVYPIGHWAQGNSGMTHAPTGWLLEDSRRVTTGPDGTVVVEGLDSSRLYRAHAPGYGVPAPPSTTPSKHDAVAPGPESALVLMLAPLRTVWARAVDAETGNPLPLAYIREFHVPGRWPEWRMRVIQALPLGMARGVLELSEPILNGDFFRMYVVRPPDADIIDTGPYRMDAPGYETTELPLQARAVGESVSKPTEVRLHRKPEAVFAPLTISIKTSQSRMRAIVQLRHARRAVLRHGFDSESNAQDIKVNLVLGTYELLVGGTSMGTIDVRGPDAIHKTVNLDELQSLQVHLTVDGAPYSGIGSVAMSPGRGVARWMFIHDRIPFRDGWSPRVVVPAGELVVAAGTGDGRYLENRPTPLGSVPGYEHASIAPGETATIELRVP